MVDLNSSVDVSSSWRSGECWLVRGMSVFGLFCLNTWTSSTSLWVCIRLLDPGTCQACFESEARCGDFDRDKLSLEPVCKLESKSIPGDCDFLLRVDWWLLLLLPLSAKWLLLRLMLTTSPYAYPAGALLRRTLCLFSFLSWICWFFVFLWAPVLSSLAVLMLECALWPFLAPPLRVPARAAAPPRRLTNGLWPSDTAADSRLWCVPSPLSLDLDLDIAFVVEFLLPLDFLWKEPLNSILGRTRFWDPAPVELLDLSLLVLFWTCLFVSSFWELKVENCLPDYRLKFSETMAPPSDLSRELFLVVGFFSGFNLCFVDFLISAGLFCSRSASRVASALKMS